MTTTDTPGDPYDIRRAIDAIDHRYAHHAIADAQENARDLGLREHADDDGLAYWSFVLAGALSELDAGTYDHLGDEAAPVSTTGRPMNDPDVIADTLLEAIDDAIDPAKVADLADAIEVLEAVAYGLTARLDVMRGDLG